MIISIEEAREIMGIEASQKYSDSEVEEMVNVLSVIANIAIDSFIEEKQRGREMIRNGKSTNAS